MVTGRLSTVPLLFLAAGGLSRVALAEECDVQAEGNAPFRSTGSARVVISGDGYRIDLPAQPAVCGAWAMHDTGEWGPPVRAGEGFLFQTCVKDGLVVAMSRQRSSDLRALEKDGPEREVFFQHTPPDRPGRSYRKLDGNRVGLGAGLRSASVHAPLVEDRSGNKIEVDVTFQCAPLQNAAAGPLRPASTVPGVVQPVRPAQAPPPPRLLRGCHVEYLLGSPADLYSSQKRWLADSATPDIVACETDILTEVRKQCAQPPAQSQWWVTGQAQLVSEGGSITLMQGFRTTCARATAHAPLCFDAPCSGALEGKPGCKPCAMGQRRDADCECRYPPGPVHCKAGGRATSGDDWAYQTQAANMGVCLGEAEQAFRRWCGEPRRRGVWAEVGLQVWKDDDPYSNVSAYRVARCSDGVKATAFCKPTPGSVCERPCPASQCLSQGACVTPGGPAAGRCGNPDGIFCMPCK
jgi:hypothetical protein